MGKYRIPNLELHGVAVDGDHAGTKLYADGEVMHWLKPLVCELQQQARLPHSFIFTPNKTEKHI